VESCGSKKQTGESPCVVREGALPQLEVPEAVRPHVCTSMKHISLNRATRFSYRLGAACCRGVLPRVGRGGVLVPQYKRVAAGDDGGTELENWNINIHRSGETHVPTFVKYFT